MNRTMALKLSAPLLALALAVPPAFACDLKVENAWIRTPPPGAPALAGYAELSNTGTTPIAIAGLSSDAFAAVQMHETVEKNGMSRMRALPKLKLAAGERVAFQPGGRHLMLMQPKGALKRGDHIVIAIRDDRGCTTAAHFSVTDGPQAGDAGAMHHHH